MIAKLKWYIKSFWSEKKIIIENIYLSVCMWDNINSKSRRNDSYLFVAKITALSVESSNETSYILHRNWRSMYRNSRSYISQGRIQTLSAHPTTTWKKIESDAVEFSSGATNFLTLERSKVRLRMNLGRPAASRKSVCRIVHKRKVKRNVMRRRKRVAFPKCNKGVFACQGWELTCNVIRVIHARILVCRYTMRIFFSRHSVASSEREPHAHRYKYVPALG